MKYKNGDVFESRNCGKFMVVNYAGKSRYNIKFTDTGYATSVRSSRMTDGAVIDNLLPSVVGVGFVGCGCFSSSKNPIAYRKWVDMIKRVDGWTANKNNKKYEKCTIHADWYNFQIFAAWFNDNFPFDGASYDLDKDKNQLNSDNPIYSPDTCSFISRAENIRISNSRRHYLLSPTNEVFDIVNLSSFIDEHGLNGVPRMVGDNVPIIRRGGWMRISKDKYKELTDNQDK